MQRILVSDYEELSRTGAQVVAGVIRQKPDAAIVVATGETPLGVYRELAAMKDRQEIDTSHLRVFQLDAYLGLAPDDPRSLYGWMKRCFLDPLGVPDSHVVRLPGDAADPESACRDYDLAVEAAGGFDLAILGLGPNGHLGFNEPPADPHSPSRVVTLTEASLASNARYWGGRDQVPLQGMTAGLASILAAGKALLLVSGAHKSAILHRTLEGPVTPDVPASYLQPLPNAVVVMDGAAWSSAPS